MKSLGMVTTGVVATLAVVAVVIGVRSIPDIRRYLRMRSM
ncbi:DUF6893 family small protein [Streptomyces sp. NPDC052042]